MVQDQRDERIQHLSHEVRKLTDELNRTRAELRRATKLVADLSIVHSPEPDTEVQAQVPAE